jgi:hypothetical protein
VAVRTVVLDANIYVSALAFGGKPKRALQLGITRRVEVAISDPRSRPGRAQRRPARRRFPR